MTEIRTLTLEDLEKVAGGELPGGIKPGYTAMVYRSGNLSYFAEFDRNTVDNVTAAIQLGENACAMFPDHTGLTMLGYRVMQIFANGTHAFIGDYVDKL